MKTCPYCGATYPDDAVRCVTDGFSLLDLESKAATVERQTAPANQAGTLPRNKVPSEALSFPDYDWSAWDGWKCVGMLLIFYVVWSLLLGTLDGVFPPFRHWSRTAIGYCTRSLMHFTLFVLTAAYFARTETWKSFFRAFGLDRKPSDRVWFGITMALVIRVLGHLMISGHWSRGIMNHDLSYFRSSLSALRYLYLFPLLVFAPLFEEMVYRGFLYKAFRGSYPIPPSIGLIVVWTVFTHWPQYSVSWIAAVDLTAITIVQCSLRERSESLWDSILCHWVFNTSILFVGNTLR